MRLLLTILLINFFCFSSKGQSIASNLTKPFKEIDFKSDECILVFEEIIHDTTYKRFGEMNKIQKLINDNHILDSLKTEFSCNLSQQSDGPHEFVISLYQRNKIVDRFVFDNPSHFNFGELNKYFQTIKKEKDETIIGTKKLNQKKKNFLKKNIDFFYSSEYEHLYRHYNNREKHDANDYKSDFKFSIEISFNTLHRIGIDRKGAIHELTKIFPEIKDVIFSCNGNQRKDDYRYYKISFPCTSDFKFNSDKLKNNNNVVEYEIIGIKPTEYYLTTLIK